MTAVAGHTRVVAHRRLSGQGACAQLQANPRRDVPLTQHLHLEVLGRLVGARDGESVAARGQSAAGSAGAVHGDDQAASSRSPRGRSGQGALDLVDVNVAPHLQRRRLDDVPGWSRRLVVIRRPALGGLDGDHAGEARLRKTQATSPSASCAAVGQRVYVRTAADARSCGAAVGSRGQQVTSAQPRRLGCRRRAPVRGGPGMSPRRCEGGSAVSRAGRDHRVPASRFGKSRMRSGIIELRRRSPLSRRPHDVRRRGPSRMPTS